jgi:phage shock protein E
MKLALTIAFILIGTILVAKTFFPHYLPTMFQTAQTNTLSPAQYLELAKAQPGELLDVRTAGEFGGGHLQGAQNLDYLGGAFHKALPKLDKTKTYYVYCASGSRSGMATSAMAQAGFSNVYSIGGYGSLRSAGVK